MSTELVWNIIKNNSSFLHKQVRGNKITTFSSDKMNLTGKYSPKDIGFCQRRPIGMKQEGNKIVLSLKTTKYANKPCKMVNKTNVKRESCLNTVLTHAHYSSYMQKAALARYHALTRAVRRAQSVAAKASHAVGEQGTQAAN